MYINCTGSWTICDKGVHQALEAFRWMVQDLERRQTHLYKLVTLHLTLDGYHGAHNYMYGGGGPPGPHQSTMDTANAAHHFSTDI